MPKSPNKITVHSAHLGAIYCGQKKDLVAAGIADDEDFPVWPKRKKCLGKYIGVIHYKKGGTFEVEHITAHKGAEGSLPFVSVVDGYLSFWAYDQEEKYKPGWDRSEVIVGRQYFIALLRHIRDMHMRGIRVNLERLMASIKSDMPRFSCRKYGFMEWFDRYMIAAAIHLNLEIDDKSLKAELAACHEEKVA